MKSHITGDICKYVLVEIGCLECDVDSKLIARSDSKEKLKAMIKDLPDAEGQVDYQIFDLEDIKCV